MTRITFGFYRRGVREPAVTLSSTAGGYIPPTPFQSASSAVTRYHREDSDAAANALDRSLSSSDYWGPAGTPQAQGWADAIRQSFDDTDRSRTQMRAHHSHGGCAARSSCLPTSSPSTSTSS